MSCKLKLFSYTPSLLIERANDRGVHDILIHFQKQVWKFENKFPVASHKLIKYAYSKLLNFCWLTKLKLRTQTFYCTTSGIIARTNDRGVHDILIHFQEQVLKFENKFAVATHNTTKYTYSKLLNFCLMTKLKLRTQNFFSYNILNQSTMWHISYSNLFYNFTFYNFTILQGIQLYSLDKILVRSKSKKWSFSIVCFVNAFCLVEGSLILFLCSFIRVCRNHFVYPM